MCDTRPMGPATVPQSALYHSNTNKAGAGRGSLEHKESYGKYFSPKDMAPDVQRLMGAIIGGQGLGSGALLS